MNFNEAYENLNRLYEGVSQSNPYLEKGIKLWLEDPKATHLIVSVKPFDGPDKGKEIEINKLAHTESEFNEIVNEINQKYGDHKDVSAIHNKGLLQYYDVYEKVIAELNNIKQPEAQVDKGTEDTTLNKQEKPIEPQKSKYSTAQLTNMRKNNNKIVNAAKEAGLDVSPLIATGTDKNGRQFKKASPELNKMRKTLFGEEIK